MTTLLERFSGASDELEGAGMPVPEGLPAVPGTSAIPWWTGVPGLDPDVRYTDWVYAAECSAMACGVYVLGADAGRAEWLRFKLSAPVKKWAEWLVGGGEADAPKRRLVLRMVCERSAAIPPDHILSAAQNIHAAATLR